MQVIKNPVGRPNKQEQSLMKHINKMYANKEFTTNDLMSSYRLQLLGRHSSPQVILGMAVNALKKKGVLKVIGEKNNNKRGVSPKLYKLSKGD